MDTMDKLRRNAIQWMIASICILTMCGCIDSRSDLNRELIDTLLEEGTTMDISIHYDYRGRTSYTMTFNDVGEKPIK